MKTTRTGESPTAFINRVEDEGRRADCRELIAMMRDATGHPPKVWGSIIGFDTYRLKYANGKEIDFMLTGFAPRKQDLVLYLGPGLERKELLAKLGKHKASGGCLHVKRLDDVDRSKLRALIDVSVREMRTRHPR